MLLAYHVMVTDAQEIISATSVEQLENLTMQSQEEKSQVIRRDHLLWNNYCHLSSILPGINMVMVKEAEHSWLLYCDCYLIG